MCEINPKHSAFFRLEVFTSEAIAADDFQRITMDALLKVEQDLNTSGKIRVHIHEEAPADA